MACEFMLVAQRLTESGVVIYSRVVLTVARNNYIYDYNIYINKSRFVCVCLCNGSTARAIAPIVLKLNTLIISKLKFIIL